MFSAANGPGGAAATRRWSPWVTASLVMMVGLLWQALPGRTLAAAQELQRIWPDNLYGVSFVDENHGWISGYAGTLLRTEDGGQTWAHSYVGHNELLRRLQFVDSNNGWAVGHRGSILHTVDGGVTWQRQHGEEGTYLRALSFSDKFHGWVVGHDAVILRTDDAGGHWRKQSLTGYRGRDLPRLHAVLALDAQRGIAAGEFGTVAWTADGGDTWRLLSDRFKGTLESIAAGPDQVVVVGLDGAYGIIQWPDEDADADSLEEAVVVPGQDVQGAPKQGAEEGTLPPVPTVSPHIQWLDSGTREHLLDVAVTPAGTVFVAGRATLGVLDDKGYHPMTVEEKLSMSMPFMWFAGIATTPGGQVWAAGIRGTVVRAEGPDGMIKQVLSLGEAGNVKRVSNRWGIEQ